MCSGTLRAKSQESSYNANSARRGVLLLVVLSMLVLFMLIGTAFMMSSSQHGKAAKAAAKLNRRGNPPTEALHRALLQILRDTDNPYSVVRYHSLLRDLYGTNGFQGVTAYFTAGDSVDPLSFGSGQTSRFADGTVANPLGATQGQFVDIYFKQLNFGITNAGRPEDDPQTALNENSLTSLDARNVLKLDRDVLGQAQTQPLPLTRGYYNGCLLTVTSGPAAGQTARIVGYDFIAEIPGSNPAIIAARVFRFRVMSFQRADGQPLQINASRSPEIGDLAGAGFIVNGRPFGGTGVGYNPLAVSGQARLTALELFPTSATEAIGAEVALLPNSVYFNPLSATTPIGAAPGIPDAFGTPIATSSLFKLNDKAATVPFFKYPTFVGPGDANESYDAVDYNNMALGMQTVTPRAQGRVVQSDGSNPPVTLSAVDPALDPTKFLRLDLEDLPLPSFHRPELANFWYHRMLNSTWLTTAISDPNIRVQAILQPYGPDGIANNGDDPGGSGSLPARNLITAIKRQSSLRPLREDHPHFDGSNPLSVPQNLPSTGLFLAGNIAIPFWEVVGPFDVDNDNDGVPDSIWVDLGDPVQEAEDGTRYKALYSFLIIDLDSRLNVNAHGLADDISPPALALSYDPVNGNAMTGAAAINLAGKFNTNILAQGMGYGPAEISLRPVFPAPWNSSNVAIPGNRSEAAGPVDSYAAASIGRLKLDGTGIPGKYGYITNESFVVTNPPTSYAERATPGKNYKYVPNNAMATGEQAVPDVAAQLKFIGYPWAITQASTFGTPPDLFGRYPIGLDYTGQPVYEVLNDRNESNNTLPRPLLTDSPYELNQSGGQRRDTMSANLQFATAAQAFSQSLVQNDDAPFSPTDLEKVLRAWDADSGTLPSRLWDCVNDFDPLKLKDFDPYRVQAVATAAFGSAGQPEVLAAAQQIAGINRRLVTTDGFSMPVVGKQMPAYIRELGADGAPGVAGINDDPDGAGPLVADAGTDNADEIGAANSDDFQALTGTKFSEGRLVDVLRYRIQRELVNQGIPGKVPYDLTNAADRFKFEVLTNQLTQQELAPELVAGQRMDLNRPFGDGKDSDRAGDTIDNNSNGVVDETAEPGDRYVNSVVDDPLEAGEPFLDINGNGRRDDGTPQGTPPQATPVEPFIDLDGDAAYSPPLDQLWQGLTAEPIAFDYTNGLAVSIHPDVVTALNTIVVGGVRNLESQGRQLYARQLYCLMLLVMDEHYIAPWDENDPQIMTWVEGQRVKVEAALTAASYPAANVKAQADYLVKRKLTCRMIAQWAVNCVDMRDPDVIATPFEYDENPWDGWGCLGRDTYLIPLDGDPSTDENGDVTKNETDVLDWKTIGTNGVRVTMKVKAPASALEQTRGLVWGAERPELLMTETLAFHDRRTEDLVGAVTGDHDEMDGSSNDRYPDVDMDQRLRPRGSLFVEIHNPWSTEGQYPAELYTRLDQTTGYAPASTAQQEGVELGRLSNLAEENGNLSSKPSDASNGIKRSPVWRMIVVEDWPTERNRDSVDNQRADVKPKTPKPPGGYGGMTKAMQAWKPTDPSPPPYHAPDPDFDEVFNAGFLPTQVPGQANKFNIDYPYIEREFYFTTDKSPTTPAQPNKPVDWNYSAKSFKLRIPDRSIQVGGLASTTPRAQTQKFIPYQLDQTSTTEAVIAPIMPGRYGVIGSAGTQYSTLPNCYTTTIGREESNEKNTKDAYHKQALQKTRRIELVPDKNPNKPQLVVASNGGDPKDDIKPGTPPTPDPPTLEIGRDNELINNKGTVENITDQNNDGLPDTDSNNDGIADNGFYRSCVAIPVEGMNISEPPWGWAPREAEAAVQEDGLNGMRPKPSYIFDPAAAEGEGSYVGSFGSKNVYSYDKPFDTAGELVRTGTTANYRSVHLQRLANPLLPWNPPAGRFKDATGNDMYRPNLPINPYLTIDTASANLTAFNGPSEEEHRIKPSTDYLRLKKTRPWVPGTQEIQDYLDNVEDGTQTWYFRSSERGAWSRLNMAGQAATPQTSPPQRVLWAQEPAMIDFRKVVAAGSNEILDLLSARNMTMRAQEVPTDVETNQKVSKKNHVNMVLEHSLGFGNKSFGTLYDAQGAQSPVPPTLSAVGAPRPGRFVWENNFNVDVNSTNPWLEWGNRPYVSAEELLNVSAGSQATMLRLYSAGSAANPYDGTGFDAMGNPVANAVRLAGARSPFGHLANFVATAAVPAGLVIDPATGLPKLDASGNVQPYGAPNFYRLIDYVQVPSRYVGTDTMLNAETFNDVPGVVDTYGSDIVNPSDPRYNFQPPFNRVSRERDPGRVNLNTVTGRRNVENGIPRIWSEVFDGIMHRFHDSNLTSSQLGHLGPAWRDIVLSRKGYAQVDAGGTILANGIGSVEKTAPTSPPDVYAFGLNPKFPTFFANPFRSPDGGDLVPLQSMVHYGVDASLMRRHHYNRGGRNTWGQNNFDDNFDGSTDDTREAGFGGDDLVVDAGTGALLPVVSTSPFPAAQSGTPLLSESFSAPYFDGNRNPYMYYQPMTRLDNLVTDRSGVFAVWITVGYFEVERAPDWTSNENGVRDRMGGNNAAALALYNRVYPDGYMLGREVGSDTGDVKRPRGFYIIDRTEEVGFKPGEDLNVEKLIRLRRRIE